MPPLVEVALQIVGSNLPQLLVDTCSVLDIARATLRLGQSQMEAVFKVIEALTAQPPRCGVVRASIVGDEYNSHIDIVKKEVAGGLIGMIEKMKVLDYAADYVGLGRVNSFPDMKFAEKLADVSQNVITKSVVIDKDDEAEGKAADRVRRKIPPARPAKQSFIDCTIFEEYLHLTREIRVLGCHVPVIFLTSNTSEYYETGKTNIDPIIKADADSVGLKICFMWSHAHHLLLGSS